MVYRVLFIYSFKLECFRTGKDDRLQPRTAIKPDLNNKTCNQPTNLDHQLKREMVRSDQNTLQTHCEKNGNYLNPLIEPNTRGIS